MIVKSCYLNISKCSLIQRWPHFNLRGWNLGVPLCTEVSSFQWVEIEGV